MNLNEVASILKMDHLTVEKCLFERFSDKLTSDELTLNIERTVKTAGDTENQYIVELTVSVSNKLGEFNTEIKLSALFTVDSSSDELKKTLIDKNTMAILFPYIRAQITLITTQPGMQPIVLPPIDINRLLQQ